MLTEKKMLKKKRKMMTKNMAITRAMFPKRPMIMGKVGKSWNSSNCVRTTATNWRERNSAEIIGEDGKFTEGKFEEEESGINVGTSRQKSNGKPLPTAVIVICMSTVGFVMLAVFVGMCVAKKRQIRCFGDVLNTEHIKEALAEAVRKSVSEHQSVMINVLIGKTNFREGPISV
uniref:Uncharacterized protein n=1 Tax=Globodera rostochiensis TaxID=31243 RepID=A0A914HVJ4_GLORO